MEKSKKYLDIINIVLFVKNKKKIEGLRDNIGNAII